MESDFDKLDPDARMARQYTLASAALGVLSLCGGIIPICGSGMAILGVILGILSLRLEYSKTASAGIGLSVLGILIALTYVMVQLYFAS